LNYNKEKPPLRKIEETNLGGGKYSLEAITTKNSLEDIILLKNYHMV
jgi:hypothetical protein